MSSTRDILLTLLLNDALTREVAPTDLFVCVCEVSKVPDAKVVAEMEDSEKQLTLPTL